MTNTFTAEQQQLLNTQLQTVKVVLVDQFGVLHNGINPYPGAVDALTRLTDAGKVTVILSNSGKRAEVNHLRMQALGFPRESYTALVSSGEVAWFAIREAIAQGQYGNKPQCYLVSRDGDDSSIAGLDLVQVNNPAIADLILLSGKLDTELQISDYRLLLKPAADKQTPCICTNPDKVELVSGGLAFGTGAIAEAYASMGGPVDYIGKPFPAIYNFALRQYAPFFHTSGTDMNKNVPSREVLCVGDSVEHDIAGGMAAGISTVLVRTGIHADKSTEHLQREMDQHQAFPDYLISSFSSLSM